MAGRAKLSVMVAQRVKEQERLEKKGETTRGLTTNTLSRQWARGGFCGGESTTVVGGSEVEDGEGDGDAGILMFRGSA